jgi:hypothetical protein
LSNFNIARGYNNLVFLIVVDLFGKKVNLVRNRGSLSRNCRVAKTGKAAPDNKKESRAKRLIRTEKGGKQDIEKQQDGEEITNGPLS